MNEIKEILKRIEIYLTDKTAKEDDLSYWLEVFICENYRKIEQFSHDVAEYLNDRVVWEICEQTEPGLEGTNFRKEIEEAYNEILRMML